MNQLPIETPNNLFGLYLYPEANEIREAQQDISWTAQEIPLEKDIQDYRHNMSVAQFDATSLILQTFVEIEQKVGEVWEQIASWYPHSEIDGCCIEIARMEKAVHAFFYQKMSDTLNIAPEDIAHNQETIHVLKSKLTLLESITTDLAADKPLALATVSLIEQVLLFSNFAVLKSFQANGNNLITNTITGVDFVISDEQIHGIFASYLHNTHLSEYEQHIGPYPESHRANIIAVAEEIIAHEDAILDYMFHGDEPMNDITTAQVKLFTRSRANQVLTDLNLEPHFPVTANPVADWFYKGASAITLHDFFVSGTSQYRRSWVTNNLSRLPNLKDNV